MIDSAQLDMRVKVDRYLAGQMSEKETADFESYMLEHPEVLDDVAITRRMKLGLSALRRKGELSGLVSGNLSATRPQFFAIAASILLLVGFGGWYLAQHGNSSATILGASAGDFAAVLRDTDGVEELTLIRTRAGEPLQVEIPTQPRLKILQFVRGDSGTNATYTVQLMREQAGQGLVLLQSVGDLHANAEGYVSLYFDPSAVGPGRYRARLTSSGATGTQSDEYLLELK